MLKENEFFFEERWEEVKLHWHIVWRYSAASFYCHGYLTVNEGVPFTCFLLKVSKRMVRTRSICVIVQVVINGEGDRGIEVVILEISIKHKRHSLNFHLGELSVPVQYIIFPGSGTLSATIISKGAISQHLFIYICLEEVRWLLSIGVKMQSLYYWGGIRVEVY